MHRHRHRYRAKMTGSLIDAALAPADGLTQELRRVRKIELILDACTIGLNRLDADMQVGGNASCVHALAEQSENLEFSVAQFLNGGPRTRMVVDESFREQRGYLLADSQFSAAHLVDSGNDLLGGLPLHDIAARAGADRALRVMLLVMHRKNDDRHGRVSHSHRLVQFEARYFLERKVDDRKIGTQGAEVTECFLRAFGFSADQQVRQLI